jgi:D-alanyl-D-alanine carboxypeptidase (penicillin-binding protein 5/6)
VGEISLADRVTVLPVAGDRGPRLATHEPVEIGDLLQLLLLSDSRTAAKTLAWAAGPSIGRCLTRMQQLSSRLGLTHTTLADDWPFAASLAAPGARGRRGSTTVRDVGRLALAVSSDPDLRRRLALDGVPISNGGLIARATAPLIATGFDQAPESDGAIGNVRISLAERDGLELLAVAAGPRPNEELTGALTRGFQRYRRVELVHDGQSVGPTVHVRGGIIPTFNAVAGEPWSLTTLQGSPPDLAFRLQLPTEINAPVEVGQPLGELVVEQKGRVLAVVPLVAPQAIAPSGWLDTVRRARLP